MWFGWSLWHFGLVRWLNDMFVFSVSGAGAFCIRPRSLPLRCHRSFALILRRRSSPESSPAIPCRVELIKIRVKYRHASTHSEKSKNFDVFGGYHTTRPKFQLLNPWIIDTHFNVGPPIFKLSKEICIKVDVWIKGWEKSITSETLSWIKGSLSR